MHFIVVCSGERRLSAALLFNGRLKVDENRAFQELAQAYIQPATYLLYGHDPGIPALSEHSFCILWETVFRGHLRFFIRYVLYYIINPTVENFAQRVEGVGGDGLPGF